MSVVTFTAWPSLVPHTLTVQLLVVMHDDRHPQQFSGEFKGRIVMRHRTAAVAADVEAGPRDEIVEGLLGLHRTDRLAVDQQRVFADPGARSPGRWLRPHQPLNLHAEPARTMWHLTLRP